jgi:hypothetical protein
MDPVLPRIQSEVNTTTEKSGLVAGFIVSGDDLAFAQRTFAAPDLFNDADLSVRDVNDPEQPREAEQEQHSSENSS